MITRAHPVARRLRALRRDAALRDSQGVFVAEGIHLAREALASKAAIESVVISGRLSVSDEGRSLARALREAGVELHEASEATLDGLQDARSPQAVVLVVRREPATLETVLAGRARSPLLVVACGVQDPGNLGALLRTADAAGATGFVAAPPGSSLTHPRAVRASMGGIFRLPAVEATLEDVLEGARRLRLAIVGAEARAAVDYEKADWTRPLALLIGGEGGGLPEAAGPSLDLRVAVPMRAGVESLSVNAAAAVLLFEAARQRSRVSSAG